MHYYIILCTVYFEIFVSVLREKLRVKLFVIFPHVQWSHREVERLYAAVVEQSAFKFETLLPTSRRGG